MEIQTSLDPAVLWIRARRLWYLGGLAPHSDEIIWHSAEIEGGMHANLADSLKAEEEDRKTDHATLVAAKENEEVATLTAKIETNLQQGDLEVGVDGMKGDRRRATRPCRSGRRIARRADRC